jgi:hypothetical protein
MGISETVEIPVIKEIAYSVNDIIHNKCQEDNHGAITLELFNTQGSGIIFWDDGPTGNIRINLPNGNYSGLIRDSLNCSTTVKPITIVSDSEITLQVSSIDTDADKVNGKFCLDIQGGIAPYSIKWDDKIKYVNIWCADSLQAGTYDLTITDGLGCKLDTLIQIQLKSSTPNIFPESLKIFPNPFTDFISILDSGQCSTARLFNNDGEQLLLLDLTNQEKFDLSHLAPGIYLFQLQCGENIAWIKLIKI